MSAVRTTPKCRAKITLKVRLPQNVMDPVSGEFIKLDDGTVEFRWKNQFPKFGSSVFNLKQPPYSQESKLEPVFDFSSVFSSTKREGYAYPMRGDRRRNLKVYHSPPRSLRRLGSSRLKRRNEYGYAKVGDKVIQLYVDGVTKAVKWAAINVSTGYLLIDGPPKLQR
jgi:hypothetical protein